MFNVDKCSVMHIGQNKMQGNNNMSYQQVPTTDQQLDLGITITKDLKWQKQRKATKQPTEYLGSLPPTSCTKTKELMIPLYKSLVRPHLEYAVQFLSPHLRLDIDKIEKVQRRATKMIPEIRDLSYNQRIKDLDHISLVQRRL